MNASPRSTAARPCTSNPRRDITGLSWSAILKNVYAMAFGMADELNLGDNTRGFLAVTALHELSAIVQQLGGASATPFRLAGLGDLITTATSTGSHHHELGRLIVRNQRAALKGEGVHSLAMIEQFRPLDSTGFPLLRLIATCVREPGNASQAMHDFINQHVAPTVLPIPCPIIPGKSSLGRAAPSRYNSEPIIIRLPL